MTSPGLEDLNHEHRDAAVGTESAEPFYEIKMAARLTTATYKRPSAEERDRLAFENRLGRRLSKQEWASYRSRLVSFFQLLRSWEKASSS
jgi:hypothetical protein